MENTNINDKLARRKEMQRMYYEKNKDAIKTKRKEYYNNNKDVIIKNVINRDTANPQKKKELTKKKI